MSEDESNSHLKKRPPIRIACGPLILRCYNLKNTGNFFILKKKNEQKEHKNTLKLDLKK